MATFLFKFAISLFFMHSIGYSVQGCEDGDVRFDPERDSVVQVCLGDQWGYICARDYPLDRWTTTDNNVFCQQMGLLGINDDSSSFVTNSSIDDGMISFQTVFCIGTE
uniref:SRCR domain-containing protein n=1 Tax=Amphimedon queenslandica TaxID=400682 RepID=A0A1X7V2B5_AMPQE